MGVLVDGQWYNEWYDTASSGGRFVREPSRFHHAIGDEGFPVASGRYHLFVSYACPWAHRTLIFRALKGLQRHVGVTVVKPLMLDNGWELPGAKDGGNLPRIDYLYELYLAQDPGLSGRVTVPVLWDTIGGCIVNNESAEIIRMFNSGMPGLADPDAPDFYPASLRQDIDALNAKIYDTVNNGVYRAGFATIQDAYEEAFHSLFATLDALEARLEVNRYLLGDTITEADWRLFTTLIRFDAVYYGHFKCNLHRMSEYHNLFGWLRELYQWPGVADTVHFDHIKTHYYGSHKTINPTGIVPVGPEIDLWVPHGRG